MGGRSRAAAQFLAGEGFKEVYNLSGGIAAWQGLKAYGPLEMGMTVLRGDETPAEAIVLAYGMELGLAEVYSRIAEKTADPDLVSLLKKLVGIEENHKERLFNLYSTIDPAMGDKQQFERGTVSAVMEGGFTTEEFMEKNKAAMDSRQHMLNVAMMLEAQAFDLYLRFAQKSKEGQSKSIFYHIAEEEKAHLASLGHLMEAGV